MVTQCATKCRWVKSELEALRAEERSWNFWRAIYNRLRTQHDPTSKRRRVLLGITPLQDHDERHPNDGETGKHDDEVARYQEKGHVYILSKYGRGLLNECFCRQLA
jgi:hypothetical protein